MGAFSPASFFLALVLVARFLLLLFIETVVDMVVAMVGLLRSCSIEKFVIVS
jgi:hypothetical protein